MFYVLYFITSMLGKTKIWQFEDRNQFFNTHGKSIRAVVGNATAGADAELIESLPKLEIVSSYSVGLDKINLVKYVRSGKWKKGDYKLTTKLLLQEVRFLGMAYYYDRIVLLQLNQVRLLSIVVSNWVDKIQYLDRLKSSVVNQLELLDWAGLDQQLQRELKSNKIKPALVFVAIDENEK
ncbi:hypothetical protein JRO89_XS09G0169200 [Xanthoceras sorbifolium]|uniref:Uncharacterized protein n=1 Tax=Xanthoceras sorbifolium TaxID=99658 RepID=A0ABQ8HLK1_9ROSI|nr:hypothetical protein JRO89_XS09G0169200 [Xanthoceras sorbifolium]